MNFWDKVKSGLEKPFTWIGDGLKWMPKILTAGKDAEADIPPVVAGITTICTDVDQIVGTGAADFAEFMVTAKPLWTAILAAVADKGLNITLDLSLIPQIQSALANSKTFENEFAKLEKLAIDWKALAGVIEADVAKLKSDFSNAPTIDAGSGGAAVVIETTTQTIKTTAPIAATV